MKKTCFRCNKTNIAGYEGFGNDDKDDDKDDAGSSIKKKKKVHVCLSCLSITIV